MPNPEPVPAIPGYRVVKTLGRGSQGVVLKAVREADGRAVAIKLLADAHVAAYRARFSQEAQVVLKLEHPNIVAGLDVGRTGDQPYVVLEFVEGETLQDRIDRGALIESEALPLIRQTAVGVQAVHAAGLVHRDLKPENIMITREGVVKLMDLGLAKNLDSGAGMTATGSVFGTPGYMSPEAARDTKRTDIRTDIYSLGATLYHAVVGEMPYTGKSVGTILRKTLTEDPVPPRQRVATLSVAADALILKMMARDPADRPQTPDDLLADLDRVARGEPPAPIVRPPARRGWWPFGKG